MLSMLMQEQFKHFIEKYNFQIFPIATMAKNGLCSCNKHTCTSPGKHPVFKGSWKKYSSNSIDKILQWQKDSYNLSVRTGLYNKNFEKFLVVVDIDNPNHELIKTLPKTFYYKTGSGGYHYWYFSKNPIKNSVSLVDKKIDIRGKGGYVIIPPSKHKKGNYSFLEDSFNDIVDLPEDLFSISFSDINNEDKVNLIKKNKSYSKVSAKLSIKEIRNNLLENKKIKSGERNETIFRLLCSDRALGANEEILKNNILYYSSFLEEPETFSLYESLCIVKSVLRYPIGNSIINTNQSYISWIEKTKNNIDENLTLDKLEELDEKFFSSLNYSKTSLTSIKDIMQFRDAWYKKYNIKHYSKYKMQAFAKELEKYNFKKKRTSKNNVWNVDLDWSKV